MTEHFYIPVFPPKVNGDISQNFFFRDGRSAGFGDLIIDRPQRSHRFQSRIGFKWEVFNLNVEGMKFPKKKLESTGWKWKTYLHEKLLFATSPARSPFTFSFTQPCFKVFLSYPGPFATSHCRLPHLNFLQDSFSPFPAVHNNNAPETTTAVRNGGIVATAAITTTAAAAAAACPKHCGEAADKAKVAAVAATCVVTIQSEDKAPLPPPPPRAAKVVVVVDEESAMEEEEEGKKMNGLKHLEVAIRADPKLPSPPTPSSVAEAVATTAL